MVYGYSNSGFCCPIPFAQGTYVRPVTNSSLAPINVSGREHPTLFGSRMIAHSGSVLNVQGASAPPYGTDFTPWLDVSGSGLELRRTDVAANGQLARAELEQWNGGTQEIGKIAVLAIQGVDQTPAFPAAVDCFVPAAGSPRTRHCQWTRRASPGRTASGLKVAGTPRPPPTRARSARRRS